MQSGIWNLILLSALFKSFVICSTSTRRSKVKQLKTDLSRPESYLICPPKYALVGMEQKERNGLVVYCLEVDPTRESPKEERMIREIRTGAATCENSHFVSGMHFEAALLVSVTCSKIYGFDRITATLPQKIDLKTGGMIKYGHAPLAGQRVRAIEGVTVSESVIEADIAMFKNENFRRQKDHNRASRTRQSTKYDRRRSH